MKVGDKLRYKNGELFNRGLKEVTIEIISHDRIWFKESETFLFLDVVEELLELVPEKPETTVNLVKGFRLLNEKEITTVQKKWNRQGLSRLYAKYQTFQVKYQTKGNFTICNVIDETGEVFNGVAKRNTKDRFNKDIGERIAFANVWD